MLKVTKELIANSLIFLLSIFFTSLTTYAQEVKDGKLIQDKFISPILKEVSSSIRKTNKVNCDLKFFSIKFIVNQKSFICDTVLFSNSVHNELRYSISKLSKTLDWTLIIGESRNAKENYEIILPIHLGLDYCPMTNFTEIDLWNIFKELIMTEGKNLNRVIILSPVNSYISTN
jgi:hypothetical protein